MNLGPLRRTPTIAVASLRNHALGTMVRDLVTAHLAAGRAVVCESYPMHANTPAPGAVLASWCEQDEDDRRIEQAIRVMGPVTAPDWTVMRPADFDATAPPQPLALFAEPDATGTLDLFDNTI